MAQGELQLVQKENFAIGNSERQIGFEPENDLSYLIENHDFFDIVSIAKNTTVDYKVMNSYTFTPEQGSTNKMVEMKL